MVVGEHNSSLKVKSSPTSNSDYINIIDNDFERKCSIESGINDNQEDSIILNKSSLDRGLYRSTSLKKYFATIQKNQSTSQNDQFMKPDPSKVKDMKAGSYDKLNEKGFVPEETAIVNGDIIIGKVSPIQPVGNSNKTFKDNSEIYKSHIPGVIDKVYTDIYNHEGYEMKKVRVRSERTPIIGDKMCCYSPDHDILTSNGWVNIKNITMEHMVACLDDNGTMIYKNPIAIQEYDFDGEMYVVESNQVSLCVTPNHRMYVAMANGVYDIELAKNILYKRRKYIKNVDEIKLNLKNIPKELTMENGKITKFNVFDKNNIIKYNFDIDVWLTVFGIWIAEGSCNGQGSVRISAHKQRVKDALNEHVPKLGFTLSKYFDKEGDTVKNCYAINSNEIHDYLKQKIGSKGINKKLPEWVWYLNKQQCRTLIDSMVLGDGHQMKGTTTIRYDTSSKQLRDDFQRLCLHAGYSSNWALKYKAGHETTIKTRNGKALDKEEVVKSNVDAYRLSVIKTQNNPLVNKNIKLDKSDASDKMVQYKGKVYCCTAFGKGIVYVRRNGKPVWCGQSRHGQKGTIGITLPQADMPFSARGISPDIIMNPNAIPSRMTVGQFVECLTGKVAAVRGEEIDGTPFNDTDISKIKKELEELGFKDDGTEELYNGMNGKKLKVRIFIGPTYYMRLKHMVSDKMHCLTMDHEVLTESGWKYFNQITDDDKLATIDINNHNKVTYEKPLNKYHYKNKYIKLYDIKIDGYIDTTITEEHRIPIAIEKYGEGNLTYGFMSIADLIKDTRDINKKHYISKKGSYGVFSNDIIIKSENISMPYHNITDVFCFTMEKETFYVRRNGCEYWTGNSRPRGPRTLLTRQAPEGRSRDGGLRVGEMERDTIISHGMSKFLKERMLETADVYTTYVCDICGLFAQRMLRKDQSIFPSKGDVYHCPACKNKTNISKIMIPYAFKLLLQELLSMSIAARIRVRKNKYSEFN